ncbi:MAG: TRAP transporter large permease [Candidatus Accumulibacter sp.]|jgi:tripartite ATP-independent transporter DctM subunit|nr:TRAP transporter large permease [Accumulibacter sp.]
MIFFLLFALFLVAGIPIAFSMGLSGLVYLLISRVPLAAVPQEILGGVDSFTLLAIPLYIFAGELMDGGGISRRILNLADNLVGHIRGGLGHVVVVATVLLSGISGSSTADTAAIGSAMIPTMEKKGYKREEAVAIIAACGGMDILVPPCITMIILGGVANLSVEALFFGGLLPAVAMALALMAVIYFDAARNNIPSNEWKGMKTVGRSFFESFWALMIPVIILGGIRIGAFTATEGAVVAVVYALFIAIFVYREVKFSDMYGLILRSAKTTGSIMFLIGVASLFAWITAREQIPNKLLAFMADFTTTPYVFLLIVNVVFLIIGAVLEGSPAVIILTPIFMPMALSYGIDPIHFGIIIIANIGVGFLLPPVGLCLLVACSVGKVEVIKVIKPIMPYFAALFATVMALTYLPGVALLLPKMVGYIPKGTFTGLTGLF